jgi:hypothetical protein
MKFMAENLPPTEKRMNTLLAKDGTNLDLSINNPDIEHPAILQCCGAWNRKYKAERASGRGIASSGCRANEAYRTAMPPLTTPENIRDFVACVTYGTMIGSICLAAGAQLLYAAQVATALQKCLLMSRPKTTPKPEKAKKLRRKNAKSGPLPPAVGL